MPSGLRAKAAEKYASAKKVAETAKYQAAALLNRKYVWNDFSIGLEKAKIKILECEGVIAQDIENTTFNQICDLTVQINPSSFSSEVRIDPRSLISGFATKGDTTAFTPHAQYADTSIELHYDIYDEFMALTGNEAYPSLSGFSLMDEKITSLPILAHFAQEGVYYVRFVWGQIKKFGLLKGLDIDYTAFSRWGEPLKATGRLHIAEMQVPDGQLNIDGKSGDLASTMSKGQQAANVAGNVGAGMKNIFR